jgi:hypothetical protein
MTTVHETLRANADECLEAIAPAFVALLGTPACSLFMRQLREAGEVISSPTNKHHELWHHLSTVPLTDVQSDGFIATLRKLSLREAVCVVDVNEPGLPMIFVNEVPDLERTSPALVPTKPHQPWSRPPHTHHPCSPIILPLASYLWHPTSGILPLAGVGGSDRLS